MTDPQGTHDLARKAAEEISNEIYSRAGIKHYWGQLEETVARGEGADEVTAMDDIKESFTAIILQALIEDRRDSQGGREME